MQSDRQSAVYELFVQAMSELKQILCTYEGCRREICPVILGHTRGQEVVLAYQFGGQSSSGLPPNGEWKCFKLSRVSGVQLREGRWHVGTGHAKRQTCVQDVDYDVNPASPYSPKRHLARGGK
jgi:predicted DNA-binding transcriptional regulator YafY